MLLTTETYTIPRDDNVVFAIKACREYGARDIVLARQTEDTVTLEVTWTSHPLNTNSES